MPVPTLRGQRVVVIGGSSGIGFAVAEAVLAEGAQVVIGSSKPANVEAAIAKLGKGATGYAVNVRDEASVESFFAAAGGFDHLVYTAGDSSKGSITLTDGVRTHKPAKGMPLSSAYGAAIEHLAKGLAIELAPVRVNAVCPGLILTEVWNSVPPERLARMTERIPLPQAGDPADVAQAYAYLMKGGYTTGQVLTVEGRGLRQAALPVSCRQLALADPHQGEEL